MTYEPKPLNTTSVELDEELTELVERVAAHVHDIWAKRRISEGWSYGPKRDDINKEHPDLVPYDELSDSEKQYDRDSVRETLRAILAMGYRVGR